MHRTQQRNTAPSPSGGSVVTTSAGGTANKYYTR